MTYFSDLNTYLHQSSQLLQAYPNTTRITTKYSLPRKPKSKKPESSKSPLPPSQGPAGDGSEKKERLPPAATLTLKTFDPGSGICLKYRTDKAAEVGRLMTGLGRLAAGEVIEMPTAVTGASIPEDKMELDEPVPIASGTATPKVEEIKPPGQAGAGGGKNKKKKGGKK